MTYGSSSVSMVSSMSSPARQDKSPPVPAVPGLYTLPLRPASTVIASQRQSVAPTIDEPEDTASIEPPISDVESQNPAPRLSDAYTIASLHRSWSKDGNNPENWLAHRRYAIITLVAVVSAVIGLFSTAFEPIQNALIADYDVVGPRTRVFANSISYLGMGVGALIIAPLGEVLGRSPVIHVAYLMYMLFLALTGFIFTVSAFLVFRFFMGMTGVVFIVLGPAIVADIMPQLRRGFALSLIAGGLLLGQALGHILGEFVATSHDPRWISWSGLIALGLLYGLAISVLRETYPPLLRNKKEISIGQGDDYSPFFSSSRPLDVGSFCAAWLRPLRLLAFSPVIAILGLFSIIHLSLSHFVWISFEHAVASEYELPLQNAVLAFLGPGLAVLFAAVFFAFIPDHWIKWQLVKDNRSSLDTDLKPEHRLPFILVGAVLVPGGIIWYGLTLQYHTHWILPILGTTILGAGQLSCIVPILMYLVDAHTEFAASAIAAVVSVASFVTGVLPLASVPLYDSLGIGWGSAVLGFVTLSLLPLAIVLLVFGERLRLVAKV